MRAARKASLQVLEGGLKAREREFLPAALEVMETPPSPAGRTLAIVICAIAAAAIAWACFGAIDIVAVASGKIVARTHTQVVQPFEISTVQAILVKTGDHVRAGDPLIELDSTAATAERDKAQKDLNEARLAQLRLEAFLDGENEGSLPAASDADPTAVARAQAQLAEQIAERDAKLAAIVKERAARSSEREALEMTLAKLAQVLPLVSERAEIRRGSAATGFGSRILSLETEQQLVETRFELDINRRKIDSLQAAVDGLDRQYASTEAEIRKTALGDLAQAREAASAAAEAFAKADHRLALQTLRAPIDGSVQQLRVASVGSVVTPAQQLLSIVPSDDRIEIEAIVENRDVGFIEAGQPVELKIDAYPFTTYGLAKGKVLTIDRDAEPAPTPTSQSAEGSQRMADEVQNVESSERLVYTAHIAIDRASLNIDGRPAPLLPGMSVRAEIATGHRRIIDYILAPLTEYRHDGLRER